MSTIARQFFADSPVIFYPIIALLLFLAVFLFVVVRVLGARREDMHARAHIPFDDAGETCSMIDSKRVDELSGESCTQEAPHHD